MAVAAAKNKRLEGQTGQQIFTEDIVHGVTAANVRCDRNYAAYQESVSRTKKRRRVFGNSLAPILSSARARKIRGC